METKDDIIKNTIGQLLCIARKYADVEDLPIPIDHDRQITTREAHTIQMIGEHNEMNVTGLACKMGVTKSAASQMTTKLVKGGFIEKKPSPSSNKEYLLSLTALGRQAFQAHEKFHGRDMADLIARLHAFSLTQITTMSVMLETISSVMDERMASGKE